MEAMDAHPDVTFVLADAGHNRGIVAPPAQRRVASVPNLTRTDAIEFLDVVPCAGVRTTTHVYRLDQANEALADPRAGRFQGPPCWCLDDCR